MSPRNSARTEKIVEVAARLFARQGYHRTSTREIARLAQVSENTLFRHFDHKEDIFWSALRSQTEALTPQRDLLSRIRAGDAPEVVLPKIFELLTDTVNYRPEVLRLIAVAFLELQEKAEVLCRDLLSPLLSEISQYLATSVAKREVLDVDPSLLAASLMAMVLMHPQLSKLTSANSPPPLDSRCAVTAYSKFWLDMLSPRIPTTPKPIVQIAQ
jgi:AcrR family transcriptional regulator